MKIRTANILQATALVGLVIAIGGAVCAATELADSDAALWVAAGGAAVSFVATVIYNALSHNTPSSQ